MDSGPTQFWCSVPAGRPAILWANLASAHLWNTHLEHRSQCCSLQTLLATRACGDTVQCWAPRQRVPRRLAQPHRRWGTEKAVFPEFPREAGLGSPSKECPSALYLAPASEHLRPNRVPRTSIWPLCGRQPVLQTVELEDLKLN